MVHVFKAGSGDWEKDGVKYDCKCVNEASKYLADGWFKTLEEALASKPKKSKAKANDKKD